MRIQVISGRDVSTEQAREWSELQRANDRLASPFFCPAFTQVVASVRRDVFVAVMRNGGHSVGFFPYQRGRLPIGKPVGGPLSDCHGVIAAHDQDWAPEQLLRQCRLSIWEFDHLVADNGPFRPYYHTAECSPIMDLSEGFEVYSRKRREAGSKQILKVGTLRRKLEREIGPVRFEAHTHDGAVLRQLLKWKSDQYVRSNLIDVAYVDWAVALLERIRLTQTEEFAGVLSALWAGDRLVAAHMGMRSKRVWHYWFPAYNVQVARFSPGLILLLEMARKAHELGVHTMDLGKGRAVYKERLMSGAVPLATGAVELPSFCAAARQHYRQLETWVRRTPLRAAARIPARLIRQVEHRLRFRC